MPFGDFYPHILTPLWKRGVGEISEKILKLVILDQRSVGSPLFRRRFGLKFFPSSTVRKPALTLFRDDTTEFFSPHGASKSVMFSIALGKSASGRAKRFIHSR